MCWLAGSASQHRRFLSTWPSCGWPGWCGPPRQGTQVFYRLENEHVARLVGDSAYNAEHAGPQVPRQNVDEALTALESLAWVEIEHS